MPGVTAHRSSYSKPSSSANEPYRTSLDMAVESSLAIAAGRVRHFSLHYGEVVFGLGLAAGWNSVSFPIWLAERNINTVFQPVLSPTASGDTIRPSMCSRIR